VVDTIRDTVAETLGALEPVLRGLLEEKGLSLDDFIKAPRQIGKS
jgi:riboflavin synthase